jgi:hypothetical protein
MFGCYEINFWCMCSCWEGLGCTCLKKKREHRVKQLKLGFARAFFDRACWHYFLYSAGFALIFFMAEVSSGFSVVPANQNGGGQQGSIELSVFPDASSWKGPIIVTFIGGFLGLPFVGPVGVMQGRVNTHFKKLEADDTIELQTMDRT